MYDSYARFYLETRQCVTYVLMLKHCMLVPIGCEDPKDHSQHNVVDISPAQLDVLLKESGHFDDVIEMEVRMKLSMSLNPHRMLILLPASVRGCGLSFVNRHNSR